MSNHLIIAIDPGQSGGIVFRQLGLPAAHHALVNMPVRLSDIADTMRTFVSASAGRPVVVMEDVGYHIQGNNAQHSATFARHCGRLEGIIATLGYPTIYVQPQLWMHWLLGPVIPKDKTARKTSIFDKVRAMVGPSCTNHALTRRTSDALGICLYAAEASPSILKQLEK